MKRVGLRLALALVALQGIAVAQEASITTTDRRRTAPIMYLTQRLSARLNHALKRGEALRARNILLDEIIPYQEARGNYIRAALLSYELGEYEEARHLFAKAEEGRKQGEGLPEASFQLSKRLVESGNDPVAFRKAKFQITEDQAFLKQVIQIELQIAASGARFKTARLLLEELKTLHAQPDETAANENGLKREVLRHAATFFFTSPVPPPIAIPPPLLAPAYQLKDLKTLSEDAEISYRYRTSLREGAYSSAKKILIEEMISRSPGQPGVYLKAARLCFELEDFAEAKRFYRQYAEMVADRDESPDARAQLQAFGLLIATEGRSAPHWESLPALRSDLSPAVLVERECRQAMSNFLFRTAKLLLGELKRLGVDERELNTLQRLLDESIKAQRLAGGVS